MSSFCCAVQKLLTFFFSKKYQKIIYLYYFAGLLCLCACGLLCLCACGLLCLCACGLLCLCACGFIYVVCVLLICYSSLSFYVAFPGISSRSSEAMKRTQLLFLNTGSCIIVSVKMFPWSFFQMSSFSNHES